MKNRNPKQAMLRLSLALLVLLTSTITLAQTAPQANSEPNEQFGGAFENDESDVTGFPYISMRSLNRAPKKCPSNSGKSICDRKET